MSRYTKSCPVCGRTILAAELPRTDSFPCPSCGEWLQLDNRHFPVVWVSSAVIGFVISLYVDSPYDTGILVAACATLIIGLSGIFILGVLVPPPLRRVTGRPFDTRFSLGLTDKSEADKKTGPKN
jgi:hypothetical protein